MKVRMRMDMSGTHNGVPYPPAGGVVELPDQVGAKLVAAGLAEPVKSKPAVESAAVAVETESADAPAVAPKRGPGRPRKDGS